MVIVAALLMIYFFIDWVIPVLLVLYAIGAVCLVNLFHPLIRLIPFGKTVLGSGNGCGVEIRVAFAAVVFAGVGVVW